MMEGGNFIFKLFKRKETIQFSGRSHPRLGILSAAIGLIVVFTFIGLSIISGLNKGQGGFYIGILGILIFVLAGIGFALSYKAVKQNDIFYRFPIVGLVINGLMLIILLLLYIMGFSG